MADFAGLATVVNVWAFISICSAGAVVWGGTELSDQSEKRWEKYTAIRGEMLKDTLVNEFFGTEWPKFVEAQKAAPSQASAVAKSITAGKEFRDKWAEKVQSAETKRRIDDETGRPTGVVMQCLAILAGIGGFFFGLYYWIRTSFPGWVFD